MTTAQGPLTRAALRPLWDDGASAPPCPTPDRAAAPEPAREGIDELILAKMRLLELRRPPASTLGAVARNPIPWAIAALLVGVLLGRSPAARSAASWIARTMAIRTAKQTASRFVSGKRRRSGWVPMGVSRNGRR